MVARAKVVKAKWSIGKGEPDDMPDFLDNDEIAEKMGGHPRGVFRLRVKKIIVVANKNGDDMLKITSEINETDKEKKGFNGYAVWDNQNITDESKPFTKRLLAALGASWSDFENNTKMIEATTVDPATITSIGPIKFNGTKPVFAKATLKFESSEQYGDRSIVNRWLAKKDEDSDEEVESDEDEDEGAEDEVEAEDVDIEEDEDEESELREELEELGLPALRKRVKANDSDAKTTGLKKPDLIELIVEQELLGEDEDEDEDEDAEEELREELSELTPAALKKRAKDNGRKIAEYRKATKDDLIEMIVEDELEGEDGDEPPF